MEQEENPGKGLRDSWARSQMGNHSLIVTGLLLCAAAMDTAAQSPLIPTPQGPPFKLQNAFGNLVFNEPVALRTPPGETNRLFVVEQTGQIYVITNLAAPNKTLFFNLSGQLYTQGAESLSGLTAMAFHPGYATNGFFFVGYNVMTTTSDGTGPHYRVSRFSVSPDNPNLAIVTNEMPLITQLYTAGLDGLCDDLLFGPDGYLYITVGDPNADNNGLLTTAQQITLGLFSGVLRIDVDNRPGNLAPNPHPATTTNYAIPADNPFIGATNFNGASVNPTNVFTEFYAVGLRNPWRMTFDNATGLLYVGSPGTSMKDEIAVISKGGNYGWSFREGTVSGPQSSRTPKGFASINPIYQIVPSSAIIGGVVYYGPRFPQLNGAFIFGDWVNGPVRALRYAGTNMVPAQLLATQVGIADFGIDPSNGDVLPVNYNTGLILRLVGTDVPQLSATLSSNSVIVSWPLAPGFVLQQNSDLATTNWTVSGYAVSTNGASVSVTVTPPTDKLFLRLTSQ
jgi:glucose/arabinose dehydrogenase